MAALIVFAAILSAAFAVTASAQWWNDNPFSDVSSDSWYHDSVRITKNNGLLSGVSESKFGSELPMTRAMFVTALASGSGYDKTEYSTDKFTDVPQGEWYASAVAWAVENGIASGTGENTFSQNKTITRQELVAMLLKYAGTAEGYFPVNNGLFRRYEPTDIKMGYHAMAEYTFLETETGFDVVRNSRSYRDRRTTTECSNCTEEIKREISEDNVDNTKIRRIRRI